MKTYMWRIGLKDRSRRNNLRFDGLSQPQGKDWYGSEEKLGIENVEIKRAHIIGKEERDYYS